MNKKYMRRLFFPLCIALILSSCFALSRLMMRPDTDYKYRSFFESRTDFDVLFFGTSHVLTSVFPLRLWNEYGITSYNLSAHGCPIQLSYWLLENTVRIRKPKVAVLDIFAIAGCQLDLNQYHRTYDAIPMSLTKIESFIDIFGVKNFLNAFTFSMNHNFWDKEAYVAAEPGVNTEMGASPIYLLRFDHSFGTESRDFPNKDTKEIMYVQRFIDFCRKNGIVPVLTFIPFDNGQESLRPWAEYMFRKARGQNVACLEIDRDGGIDFETDMADLDSHLNPSGGRKVTDFIGSYISKNIPLEDHRGDESYSWWGSAYESYKNTLRSRIRSQKDLKMALLSFDKAVFHGTLHLKSGYTFSGTEQKFIDEIGDSLKISYDAENDFFLEVFDLENIASH